MNHFYLDASAHAKLYFEELGSNEMELLLDSLSTQTGRLVITSVTLAETVAVLNRKRNELRVPNHEYALLVVRVFTDSERFSYWPVNDEEILNAIPLISIHNINSSDALHLYIALRLQSLLERSKQGSLVLVASDKRLVRAGHAEGLLILNPEETSATEIAALLG
jgi:predicted nucleic acid-binding protein